MPLDCARDQLTRDVTGSTSLGQFSSVYSSCDANECLVAPLWEVCVVRRAMWDA